MAFADSIRNSSATMDAVASLIEGIFVSGYPLTYSSWTPTLSAGGSMTYTSTSITYAKYFQVGKLVFFTVDVTGTCGGTPHRDLKFTLPVTASTSNGAAGGAAVTNVATTYAGFWYLSSSTVAAVNLYNAGTFAAGVGAYRFSSFYEAA